MTINETTGQISWPNAGPADSLYPVTIRASNTLGSDTESYAIRVMLPPALDALSNETSMRQHLIQKLQRYHRFFAVDIYMLGAPPDEYQFLHRCDLMELCQRQ